MTITSDSQIALSEQVLFQKLIAEGALMHLEIEEYFTVNEIGSIIIALLEEKSQSVQEICSRVIEEYEVEPNQLEQDVMNYVQELVDLDIVKVQ
jgi:hypothetical protein